MKKKLLSILLALALVCSSVPAPVFAADGDTTTSTSSQSTGETTPAANGEEGLRYLDDKGELKTHQEGYDALNGWTTELPEGWYLVSGTVELWGTLTVTGDVTIVLADGAQFDAEAGIKIADGATLTLTAQSKDERMGRAEITGTGESNEKAVYGGGNLTVYGGEIAVIMQEDPNLPIWSGSNIELGGALTVTGGRFTVKILAMGSSERAGDLSVGQVTLSGGTVKANAIQGSFSTGADGHAVLYANTITGSGNTSGWNCIWFKGTEGTVYGDVMLDTDLTVGVGETLTVPAGTTLNDGGKTITNNGTIRVRTGGSYAGKETSPNKISYEGVTYLDEQGNTQTTTEKVTLLDDSTQNWTLTTGWYLVRGSFTVSDRITISGEVTLILADGAHLEAEQGIGVSAGSSLTITAQSTGADKGRLIATGSESNAGIGGNGGSSGIGGGSITINGGRITATGGDDGDNGFGGAGIGGGNNGAGGSIEINGGVITATGGGEGAGIGGGNNGSGGNITITGGVIEATGKESGAGIGGGYEGTGGTISISGGTVVAAGDGGGAGIGGGYRGRSGDITITGGSITADGSSTGGAGIGGGANRGVDSIKISGGIITARSNGNGTDIGMGSGSGGTAVVLDGNAVIYANAIERSDEENWNCIWFKETAGTVYGDVTLGTDLTVEEGETLTIEPGATLNDGGKTITNNGTIRVRTGGSYVGEETSPNKISYEGVTYLDEQGNTQTTTEKVTLLDDSTQNWTLTTGWYLVRGSFTVSDRITISGEVTLILADGAHLEAEQGIGVSAGSSLTITAQSKEEGRMGALTATSSGDAAGIGGEGGSITIWGGNIRSEAYTTGIGGENSTVVIRDGVVSAVSTRTDGTSNYGIGSNGGYVTISGGRVIADSGRVNGFDIFGSVLSTDKPDGSNGNAVICWGSMSINSAGADYIWADGQEKNYRVYGEVTLTDSFEVGQEATLIIPEKTSLTVPEGVTLKNNGTIKVEAGGRYVGAETSPNKVEYEQVRYLDENGEEKLTTGPVGLVTNSTTELESGWYLVQNGITIPQRLTVSGEVTLILADWCELNARGGIEVSEGNSLTITAQSADADRMGRLTATGADLNPGIGGNGDQFAGTVIINGGKITASAKNGAGIGGIAQNYDETYRSEGAITINGGIVNATGGGWAPGIGIGGNNGSSVAITINGGEITAVGGEDSGTGSGAGIGTRENSNSGFTITINGGRVHATSRNGAAGIGCGAAANADSLPGKICITGGTVIAEGAQGTYGAGAGIGDGQNSRRTDRVTIEISGGVVTAIGGEGAADIGNGNAAAGTSFSTGEEGNAIITAATITGSEDTDGWNCIWFESEGADGSVFGEVTLDENLTIGAGRTLTVEPGATLTVPAGVSLANNGTIKVELRGALVSAQQVDGVLYYIGWDTDEDGAAEQDDYLAYGTEPDYSGAEPVKENTAQYTYTFRGWSPGIAAVTGPVLYTAQFDSTVNQYTVTLPTEQVGYTLVPQNSTTVNWGETFSFTLQIADGYSKTEDFAVLAGGTELTAEDGVYNVTVEGDTAITVTGVADVTAPTGLTVSYGEDHFREFLNNITFGLFFKDTVTVTFTATDAGSGVAYFTYDLGDGPQQVDAEDGKAEITIAPEFRGQLSGVTAVDAANNASTATAYEYFAVEKDAPTAPTLTAVCGGDAYVGGWVSGPVTVTVSGSTATSNIAKYQYSADGGESWQDLTATGTTAASDTQPANVTEAVLTLSGATDQEYLFRAVSNAGNLSASTALRVQIDPVAPTLSVQGDTEHYRTDDTVSITVSAGDSGVERVEVKREDGSWEEITGGSYPVTENGSYTFRVTSGAGLTAEQTLVYTKLDRSAPTLTVDTGSYSAGSWTKENVTLTAAASGTLAPAEIEISYRVDGGDWQPYAGPLTVTADTEGTVYTFRAASASGVESETVQVTVRRDTVAPTLSGVENGGVYYTTQQVTAADDHLASVTLNGTTVDSPVTLTGNTAATYTLVATDAAGNTATLRVTMRPISSITLPGAATSAERDALEEIKQTVSGLLDGASGEEKKELEALLEKVETALEEIEQAEAAQDAASGSVGDLDLTKPQTADKDALIEAQQTIEDALNNHGENYTEEEKAKLEELLDRVEAALGEIEQAETAGSTDAIDKVEALDPDKIQTSDKGTLEQAKEDLETALGDYGESYTDEEKAKLEDLLEKVETALGEIEQAEAAGSTDAIDKVEALGPDKVQTSDKGTLEQAKEDLEAALGNYGESYTDEEKAKLEELLEKVETALGVIEKAEAVQGAVDALPDTVAPDDLETIEKIEAAKEEYDRLTDQEKELAGGAGEKLDQLLAAMIDYRILEGDGSVWSQEGGETLSIRANGAPAKLVDLLLDGSSIPAEGYTIRSGSTIATLTPAYLATLAPGQHTLTFVYQDGQVSATFTIAAKTADDTTSGGNAGSDGTATPDAPNTGDPTSPALWAALALVCIAALAAVLIWQRKRAQR